MDVIGTPTTKCHALNAMRNYRLPLCRLGFAVIVLATLHTPTIGVSQDLASPEPVAVPPVNYSPFAVGGSVRKALPPLDCLRCLGPAPYAPCDSNHHRFLFYGTCASDDDCMNAMHDCIDGECGHVAARLSRAWHRLHKVCKWPVHHSHGDNCEVCGRK